MRKNTSSDPPKIWICTCSNIPNTIYNTIKQQYKCQYTNKLVLLLFLYVKMCCLANIYVSIQVQSCHISCVNIPKQTVHKHDAQIYISILQQLLSHWFIACQNKIYKHLLQKYIRQYTQQLSYCCVIHPKTK